MTAQYQGLLNWYCSGYPVRHCFIRSRLGLVDGSLICNFCQGMVTCKIMYVRAPHKCYFLRSLGIPPPSPSSSSQQFQDGSGTPWVYILNSSITATERFDVCDCISVKFSFSLSKRHSASKSLLTVLYMHTYSQPHHMHKKYVGVHTAHTGRYTCMHTLTHRVWDAERKTKVKQHFFLKLTSICKPE